MCVDYNDVVLKVNMCFIDFTPKSISVSILVHGMSICILKQSTACRKDTDNLPSCVPSKYRLEIVYIYKESANPSL